MKWICICSRIITFLLSISAFFMSFITGIPLYQQGHGFLSFPFENIFFLSIICLCLSRVRNSLFTNAGQLETIFPWPSLCLEEVILVEQPPLIDSLALQGCLQADPRTRWNLFFWKSRVVFLLPLSFNYFKILNSTVMVEMLVYCNTYKKGTQAL